MRPSRIGLVWFWATFLVASVRVTSGIEERPAPSNVGTERETSSSDGLVQEDSSTGIPRISSTGLQNVSAEYKKVCRGTSSGFGHTDDQVERYNSYKARYTNCTHVDGNLEIVFLSNYTFDLSFLQSIREIGGYVLLVTNYLSYIPLTNLRIIRGRTLFEYQSNYFSLYIALNYDKLQPNVGLKELRFTSLHEIMAGSIFVYDNPQLCFHDTIDWKDILSGEGAKVFFNGSSELKKLNISVTCGKCHESCGSHCWGSGPEHCQKLTRVSCSPQCDGHCFGPLPSQCCNPECAGGCTGPSTSQCWSCKNFDNGGVCANVCPALEIYSPHEYKMVPNRDFKYAYGSLCVDKCPAHLIADKVSCVQDCGAGKMAGKDGKCHECNGPCPKSCNIKANDGADYINSNNIKEYEGCTIIQGSIKILDASFTGDTYYKALPMKMHQLSALESVQEVTDFVQIQANDPLFRNLTFLKNLKIIHGRNLDRTPTSLQIFKTSLESLGLDSLEEIRYGHIYVANNSRLCYASSVKWEKLRAKPEQKTIIEFNRNPAFCAQDREVCDSECTDDGCWGPFDSQCISCRNFHFGDRCIRNCTSISGIFQSGDKECQKCNEQCLMSCSGLGADKCNSCRSAIDGPYCVDQCPKTKYMDENRICQPCHPNCDTGCTGPKNTVGAGACNSCPLVVFASNRRNITECLKVNSPCPDGFYQQKIPNNTNHRELAGKQGCMKCHPQCTTCLGYGAAFCLSCRHYRQEDECVSKCRDDYFVNPENNECLQCDPQCLHCHGPTAADCTKCKLYKVYSHSKVGEITVMFNCTDTCPDFAPYKQLDETMTEMTCVTESNEAVHRQRMVIIIVVAVVSISVVIVVVSMILCSQRNKARKSAQKLTDRMQRPYEAEPLKPTDAKPDMAQILIISESELRWGNYILGSGAFGTVFKGVWIPGGKPQVPVAIKVLQKSSSGQSKEFLDEARIMFSVNHPCCVHILGICLSAQMMLITQLMPLGCLLEFIRKNKEEVGSAMLLNWCKQIAEGMNHLESHGIVHCDLAARNVLVESAEQVKITDFGLAKMLEFGDKEFQAEGGKMPIKWLAIESITTRKFTHKSDVWSFGVTLWELFTFGKRPYENVHVREIPIMLDKGERLLQPSVCSIQLYMLMAKCWLVDPEKRPKFEVLVNNLSDMAKNPQEYLHIPYEDHLMRLRSNSQSSDYDSHFDHYIEPLGKGSNMSIRYTRQPTTKGNSSAHLWRKSIEEDPTMSDKSRPLSSRHSDLVKPLETDEYETMSPASAQADDCFQTSDALPQYINMVDGSSDSVGNDSADSYSTRRLDSGIAMAHKNLAVTNPEYFDSFHDAPAKGMLRYPDQKMREGRGEVPRSRTDSLGFTEESSRSSADGSEHEYYNFYHAPQGGLGLQLC